MIYFQEASNDPSCFSKPFYDDNCVDFFCKNARLCTDEMYAQQNTSDASYLCCINSMD